MRWRGRGSLTICSPRTVASPQDKDFIRSLKPGKPGSSSLSSVAFPTRRKRSASYEGLLDYFVEKNVQLVVRLNNPLYDKADFESRGIAHKDMFFEDGTKSVQALLYAAVDWSLIGMGGLQSDAGDRARVHRGRREGHRERRGGRSALQRCVASRHLARSI